MSRDIGSERTQSRTRNTDREVRDHEIEHRAQEGHVLRDDVVQDGGDAKRTVEAGDQDLQYNTRTIERGLQGDFRRDYRRAAELLHQADGQSLVSDVRKGEHILESGIEHAANMVELGLPAISSRQDLLQGERDVEKRVKGAVRIIGNELPGFDVHQDVHRGKRDLQRGMHRLKGSSPVQGVRRGEEHVRACFKSAERAVEQLLPGLHVGEELRKERHSPGQDIRAGGRALGLDLKGAEKTIEVVLRHTDPGPHIRKSEHYPEKGLQKLGGKCLMQDQLKGEHDFKASFKDAEKVVKLLLLGLYIGQDIRGGAYDLREDMRRGVNIAEKDVGKA